MENDVRKMFFQKLLTSSDTSVISGTMDNLRKAQSMDHLDSKNATEEIPGEERPRSASPNLTLEKENLGVKAALDTNKSRVEDSGSPSVQEQRNKENKEPADTNEEKSNSEEEGFSTEAANDDKTPHDQQTGTASPQHSDETQTETVKKLKPLLAKRISSDSKRTHFSKENMNLNIDESTTSDRTEGIPESPASSRCRPFVDIPEFNWSVPHQRLLTELLFSIEKDIQVWKT